MLNSNTNREREKKGSQPNHQTNTQKYCAYSFHIITYLFINCPPPFILLHILFVFIYTYFARKINKSILLPSEETLFCEVYSIFFCQWCAMCILPLHCASLSLLPSIYLVIINGSLDFDFFVYILAVLLAV